MKPWTSDRACSLRWRLLLAIGAVVISTWLITGWFSYTKAQHEAEELMDGSLAQTARLLLAITRDTEANIAELATRLASVRGGKNIYEPPLEFQIGDRYGSVLARSLDAPEFPILGVVGYHDIERRDMAWRVLNVASEDGGYRVQIAQSISLRDRAALEVATRTVLPLILIVPALMLLIYLSISRTLRPLEKLANVVSSRSPDNLTALIDSRIPTEARPLVGAINGLFKRVERALDNERRFTADAAHELRTPLAALKVQTQVALLGTDPPVREHAIRQIEAGVDRAGRLVEQLLRLARLDPLTSLSNSGTIDLTTVIDDVLGTLANADRVVRPDAHVIVSGAPDLLHIAVRNLIDNALRYSPDKSEVEVRVSTTALACTLTVLDQGPGVPEAALHRLGERFFRAQPGTTEGNGLGLTIVARIGELHGARIEVFNRPEGGLAVSLVNLPLFTGVTQPPLKT